MFTSFHFYLTLLTLLFFSGRVVMQETQIKTSNYIKCCSQNRKTLTEAGVFYSLKYYASSTNKYHGGIPRVAFLALFNPKTSILILPTYEFTYFWG